MDRKITYITDDARISVYDALYTCTEAMNRFSLDFVEAKLLSQGLLSSLILTQTIKENIDRVAMYIDCTGAVGGIYAEADNNLNVRGYLKNHPLDFKNQIIHSLSDVIGAGEMRVIKRLGIAGNTFTSSTVLESGNIAYDLAVFFLKSEQRNVFISMWVDCDEERRLECVRALFIEPLPNFNEERIEELQSLASALSCKKNKGDIDDFAIKSFPSFNIRKLSEKNIKFYCPCSKERFLSYINALSLKERTDMLNNDSFPLEIQCEYCANKYYIQKDEINLI